jgi:hypothetical protein
MTPASLDRSAAPLWLDRLLARRGTRDNTFGPTGARLFCPHLENAFGLRGRFCFVHDRSDDDALFDPARLTISVNGERLEGNRASCMWYPSHARRQVRERDLGIIETKFISWDDVICDVLTLTNHSTKTLAVKLEVQTAAAKDLSRPGKDTIVGTRVVCGQRVSIVLAMPTTRSAPADKLICELKLKPGEQTSLLIAMAVAMRQNEAQKAVARWAASDDPLLEQQRQYQRWFDVNCPRFDCPDERLVRLWWYRWFVVRHNLIAPGLGRLDLPVCYPSKTGPAARLSAADGYAILRELRWLRDSAHAHSQIRAHAAQQSAEGLYEDGWLPRCSTESGGVAQDATPPDSDQLEPALDATVGLPAAFADALSVHSDPSLLSELAPGMAANLAALRKLRDVDNNLLLSDPTLPIERVDSTAFYAVSLQAAAEAISLLDKKVDAQWHEGLADRCRQALLTMLWCEWSDFFCDLTQGSGLPIETPQTRSLLPFALGLVPENPQYAVALDVLVDPKVLWTPYPVAETALETVSGGTVRPDLDAMVADVLADAIRNRRQNAIDRLRLRGFIDLYARLMCEEGDPSRPQTRHSYDALTGQGEGALDVFVDAFNDLIIRHLIGLVPQGDDTLLIDPLGHGFRHFRADDVPYRGHLVTIIWESRPEGERYPDAVAGLTVRVDGQLVAQSPQLEKIVAALPQS